MQRTNHTIYRSESDPSVLLKDLKIICELADSEKVALGFLPKIAYDDAIRGHRLIAMYAVGDSLKTLAGFIFFGGVFPNGRVQQIAVAKDHRNSGIATALLNTVVARLESRGYVSISAAVADDLSAAQAFYERNGFIVRHSRKGGSARGRTIILRSKNLANESLLPIVDDHLLPPNSVDLGLWTNFARKAPLYAIDLNVLFDLVKAPDRPRSDLAARLLAAALQHKMRLAVAPEFVVELERTTTVNKPDPILALARQLPRLPSADEAEMKLLTARIHKIAFVDFQRADIDAPQAMSDARHLAQAASAGAAGYITSDGGILDAQDRLLQAVGIDVVSLEEFIELIADQPTTGENTQLKGTECVAQDASVDEIQQYIRKHPELQMLNPDFLPPFDALEHLHMRLVKEESDVIAVSVYRSPSSVDAPARIILHVEQDHVASETIGEFLLDEACQRACGGGPVSIELPIISSQSSVRAIANRRGFFPRAKNKTLNKIAIGRPITMENWATIARQLRHRTGFHLSEMASKQDTFQAGFFISKEGEKALFLPYSTLEQALSPTIIAWQGRGGVVAPIAKSYADDLLGTGDQFPLFGTPEAGFTNRRIYFSSPRTAKVLHPGLPIFFYESVRTKGRGALIAVARIIDTTVWRKDDVPIGLRRRAVVEDLRKISKSNEVLATTFDNLLRFPIPMRRDDLTKLGVGTNTNFRLQHLYRPFRLT